MPTVVLKTDHYFDRLLDEYGFEAMLSSGVAAELMREPVYEPVGILESLYAKSPQDWYVEVARRCDAAFRDSLDQESRVRMEAERLQRERDEARRAKTFNLL